jgi:2-methylisocitrate lyase-like PEP mutase family enzyme
VDARERKAAAFRDLHAGPLFIIPNPWDAGSARALAALGFRALATTSSGFAFTLGRRDGSVSLEEVLAHVEALDRATDLPVSADLENGYAEAAAGVATAIRRVAAAGAVGASIEDYDRSGRIYPLPEAVERVQAAVDAARGLPVPFTLTARAENHIRGNPDLDDTIERLQAFEASGADVLFAPGLRTREDLLAVCASVSKPVNVLALPGMSMSDIAASGARRVSLGGGLTWVAAQAMARAATALLEGGDLSLLVPRPPLDAWFS